ncbi:MAG: ABC transporter ATP-binding protein [Spirochaetales bacterium]
MVTFPQTKKAHTFVRFLAYVKPYSFYIVVAALGGMVKFTLPLFVPQITRHLIDNVFMNPALESHLKIRQLLFLCGGMIALYIFVYAPFTYYRHYFSGVAGHKAVFDLRCDLYYHVLRMSSSFFNRNKSGGIVSRLIGDVALAENLVGNALTNIWIDGTAIFVILYFLLRIDVTMTLVALSTFPLYLFFFRKLGARIKENSHEVQQSIENLAGRLQEKVAGSVIIRAFAAEKIEEDQFAQLSDQLLSTTMKNVRLQSVNMVITGALTGIAPLIVIIAGGLWVISGSLSVGDLVAIGMYIPPLYLPLQRFSELNVVFANSIAALDRIFEIMDMEPEIKDKPTAREVPIIRGDIAFHHVWFGYTSERPVLQDIHFAAEAGKRVALVGRSGAGKSTLVSLISRFYDVSRGCITLDGIDIRDITLASLRSHIGIVLQDTILFSGTIRENILYGRPKASEAELIAAARAANAYDFIQDLPLGFDTEIGERGVILSGGQKQRITLARAFLKDPRILILDEATSSLDSESEILIQEALARLMKGRTSFIIAHRLSTIMNADLILVLDRGRILESGNHRELLEGSKVYRHLHDAQFRRVV